MRTNIGRSTTILLVAVITMLSGCKGEPAETIAGINDSDSMLHRTTFHDGIEREYFIHLPTDFSRSAGVPLVVAIHGYTSTATGFQMAYSLNAHADAHGYMIVYPQGSYFAADGPLGEPMLITSWNDLAANQPPKPEGPHCTADRYQYPCPPECGECGHCGWTSCYDDAGFIDAMIGDIQAEFSPDANRVYLLGVSNGGMMALRLACNMSSRFAAVVPIIAQLAPGYACGPDTDLPMLHLYGGVDDTVRHDGLPGGDGYVYTSASETAKLWADALACDSAPNDWQNELSLAAGLSCKAYSNCREPGHEVVSCMAPDGGHDWPGQRVSGMPATCVTAEQAAALPDQERCPTPTNRTAHKGMDLVWDFVSRYRKTGDVQIH